MSESQNEVVPPLGQLSRQLRYHDLRWDAIAEKESWNIIFHYPRCMLNIKIDPSLFREEEVEVVEDLIAAAYKDAKASVEARMQEKMADITGGLQLPPGMGIPGT